MEERVVGVGMPPAAATAPVPLTGTPVAVASAPGEADDFAAFVARHGGGLFRAVRRRVASPEDAQDVVQEALLRTWRRRHDHADDTHRRNFAHLVADRLVIDLHRSKDHQVEARATFAEDALGSAPSPADLCVRGEDRARVMSALRALPEDQRALLVDADLLELSLDELRERYGATAEVLRYRRFRARRALRRQLERTGVAPALPLLLLRRPVTAFRNLWHRLGDTSWLPTGAQAAVVVVTTISMVTGPFNGATGPVRDALAAEPPAAVAAAPPAARAVPPAPVVVAGPPARPAGHRHAAAAPVRVRPEQVPPRTDDAPAPITATTPPNVCVDTTCLSGDADSTPGDVLSVEVPGAGRRTFRQDAAPVCTVVPDQPVVGCHTEGDPNYIASPPPVPEAG